MSEYIDLVLVKHHETDYETYMFQAPRWSDLKKGDEVIVETCIGEQKAKVIDSYTISTDYNEEEFNFILTASKAKLPLKKVLKKVEYHEYSYPEPEEVEEAEEVEEGSKEGNE